MEELYSLFRKPRLMFSKVKFTTVCMLCDLALDWGGG